MWSVRQLIDNCLLLRRPSIIIVTNVWINSSPKSHHRLTPLLDTNHNDDDHQHRRSRREPQNQQQLVVDLSFDADMTRPECYRLARDLLEVYRLNSSAATEANIVVNLCCGNDDNQSISTNNNNNNNSITLDYLRQYLPKIDVNGFGDHFRVYPQSSYRQLFPTERLVYLTADSADTVDYNTTDIYIIGGLVEKRLFKKPSNRRTLLKARAEGLRSGRLPIDDLIGRHMTIGCILFLPQIYSILRDVKLGSDWEQAVRRYVPHWKLTADKHYRQV
ncbi:mitochondrial ribonuclease P protein 1 homolog [Oppia nitens]|uniref:mitochondrial ribonuclease P protein 1 homolog n=1 Tax=Oppia nitens TaxID=1686743 RepID=UPI0023DB83ED|nr:mitochondrial ribonuclease P protein 1 homolog [Oppia nitens]